MCNDSNFNNLDYNNLKCNNLECNDIKCKYCGSNNTNKDGIVNNGNQRYLCRDYKKVFIINKDRRNYNK